VLLIYARVCVAVPEKMPGKQRCAEEQAKEEMNFGPFGIAF